MAMTMAAPSARAVPSLAARPGARAAALRAAGAERGGKWWAPLVGWSGKADYLEAPAPAGSKRAPPSGLLTEEKARELRARMAQTESFHDAMYHSAIASRLARSA